MHAESSRVSYASRRNKEERSEVPTYTIRMAGLGRLALMAQDAKQDVLKAVNGMTKMGVTQEFAYLEWAMVSALKALQKFLPWLAGTTIPEAMNLSLAEKNAILYGGNLMLWRKRFQDMGCVIPADIHGRLNEFDTYTFENLEIVRAIVVEIGGADTSNDRVQLFLRVLVRVLQGLERMGTERIMKEEKRLASLMAVSCGTTIEARYVMQMWQMCGQKVVVDDQKMNFVKLISVVQKNANEAGVSYLDGISLLKSGMTFRGLIPALKPEQKAAKIDFLLDANCYLKETLKVVDQEVKDRVVRMMVPASRLRQQCKCFRVSKAHTVKQCIPKVGKDYLLYLDGIVGKNQNQNPYVNKKVPEMFKVDLNKPPKVVEGGSAEEQAQQAMETYIRENEKSWRNTEAEAFGYADEYEAESRAVEEYEGKKQNSWDLNAIKDIVPCMSKEDIAEEQKAQRPTELPEVVFLCSVGLCHPRAMVQGPSNGCDACLKEMYEVSR